jgi:3-hydroxyisobutyrate dehydrogenase
VKKLQQKRNNQAMKQDRNSVGVVGIGNMGWPMAARLVNAGFDVCVYDAAPDRARAFVAEVGGRVSSGLAQLASEVDTVITMLPNSRIVGEVIFNGNDCLSAGMRPGTVLIEMSSGVPERTCEFAERLNALNIQTIDAPVSGGVPRAKTGELAIMVGGDAAPIDASLKVLNALGTTILRTGPIGSGQAMKALNNLVSAGGFLIAAEAVLIGKRFGLEPEVMIDVLNSATGMNNSTQKKFKQFVLSRSFASGFGLDLMVKDLTIALDVGGGEKDTTPFSKLCLELWKSSAEDLGAGRDHTELFRFSERLAGLSLERDSD